MKIALVVYNYGAMGGIEKYVRMLAEKYVMRGHEVNILTTRRSETASTIMFHVINVTKMLPSFVRLKTFQVKVARKLRKEKYDIIHSQGADCLTHNVLTAHSCHRAWVEKSKRISFWELLKKTFHPLHRIVVRNEACNYSHGHYQKIIAVSNEVKKEVVGCYGVPESCITVVYPGIDLKEFDSEDRGAVRATVRKEIGLQDNEYAVLFVANEFRRKGLATILNVLGRLQDRTVKLIVVGKGTSFLYRLYGARRGLAGRVTYIPSTPHVSRYFAAADLFLLPTKHEAFGMVIAEAMASRLPVLVSRIAGAAELIHDNRCLIDDPYDESEILEKLKYFVSNREVGRMIGSELRMKTEGLAWDLVAQQTLEVYATVCGKRNDRQ